MHLFCFVFLFFTLCKATVYGTLGGPTQASAHEEFILGATQRRVQPLIKAVCLKKKELESAVALTDGVALADDVAAIVDAANSDVEGEGGDSAQYN
jgi:hypothetical protein